MESGWLLPIMLSRSNCNLMFMRTDSLHGATRVMLLTGESEEGQ
jgi:hypothetical protein